MALKTILIVGAPESVTTALESSYATAFSQLGCQVVRWNPAYALSGAARFGRLGRVFSTFVHVEPWVRKANLELLLLAVNLRPDLILVIGTLHVRAGTLAQIRVCLPTCPIYCIYPDSPHLLDTERAHCFPFFDRLAVSSPAWIDAFERFGGRNVQFLPFAADTTLHQPVPKVSNNLHPQHDVAFVGTWRLDREQFLEQLTDFDLIIWGGDYWRKRTRPESTVRRKWGGKPLQGKEYAQACANNRIMLNIMDPATLPGPNMRSFEQPACRAFSLVTRSTAVTSFFKEGETVECFGSVEEARSKIRYYLDHEEARERIADASYRFVVEGGHTYVDRAKQLLAWLDDDRDKP